MIWPSILVFVVGAVAPSLTSANPPFTPAEANAHDCHAKCQAALEKGLLEDKALYTPSPVRPHSFYSTAKNFTKSKPGDLLKLEPIEKLASYDHTFNLPPGVTLYAIQYTSLGLNDKKVPATGFIAFPYTLDDSIEESKFPLVSFAHGTSGYLPNCAPTGSQNFYDYYTWAILTLSGFAVVATDYAGLGSNATRHVYNTPTINANDVLFAALAAKKAFPDLLTRNWAAAGHSQGGGAVYALTESERIKNRDDFVGSVAISPSARVYDLFIAAASSVGGSAGGSALVYTSLFVWASQVLSPPHGVTKAFSETFLKRYRFGNKLGVCLNSIAGLFADLGVGKTFTNNGISEFFNFFKKAQKEYGAGLGKKAYAPLLLVQSTGDLTVDSGVTEKAFNASCNAGNEARLVLISHLDHSATPAGTSTIWTRWLQARISQGRKPMGKCTKVKPKAVDKSASFAPLDF